LHILLRESYLVLEFCILYCIYDFAVFPLVDFLPGLFPVGSHASAPILLTTYDSAAIKNHPRPNYVPTSLHPKAEWRYRLPY
jgi:hypothetical protein